jgi:hypothetical protein
MASFSQQQQMLQMTQALFNAVPGATYLSEFTQLLDQGETLSSLSNALTHSLVFNAVMLGYSYDANSSAADFAGSFVSDLLGSRVTAENRALVVDYITQQMAAGKTQADMIGWATQALSQVSSSDADWGAAAADYKNAVTTKIVDNLLGDSVSAENKAAVIEHIVASVEQGQTFGNMIEWAVTALDSVPADNTDFGSAAALFDERIDIANEISVVQGASFTSLQAIQLTQSLMNQAGDALLTADVIAQMATLAELADSNPEVVAALLPDSGDLTDLLASMPVGSTFADVVALTVQIASSATDLAAVTDLLGDGATDLSAFLDTLPEDTSVTDLIDTAASGDLADLTDLADDTAVVTPPAGGGGAVVVAPTFTVTEEARIFAFGGTATGNITVAWAGTPGDSVATFTRGGIDATTEPDFSGTPASISLAVGQTLAAAAVDVDGMTIDGTGTVLVDALDATAAADLSNITATIVLAQVANSVSFTGNLGSAVVAVVDGATLNVDGATLGTAQFFVDSGASLEGTAATLTGVTALGDGTVNVNDLVADTDLSQMNAALQVDAHVSSAGIDITANANLGVVDAYIVDTGADLTLTAAQAATATDAIDGGGGVTVEGSAGNQTFTIATTGTNSITPGLGLDTVMLGAGTDTVVVGTSLADLQEAATTATTADTDATTALATAQTAADATDATALTATATAARTAADEAVAADEALVTATTAATASASAKADAITAAATATTADTDATNYAVLQGDGVEGGQVSDIVVYLIGSTGGDLTNLGDILA